MPDARDVGIINVPLQSVPPGEGLLATSNHQSTPEHIRSGLDALLVGHPLLDTLPIQVGPVHRDPTARPLFWLHPAIVGNDVALEVRNALVRLGVIASDDGALEVGLLVDQQGAIFALEVARGDVTLVRVRTPASARRRNALFGFGGGRTGWREALATGRLGLGGGLALLLFLGGSDLDRTILVIVRGRDIVGIAFIQFGAIAVRGRGGWAGRGRRSNACIVRSGWGLRRVATIIEGGCVGRHGRRVEGCRGEVDIGEGLCYRSDRIVE